MKRVYLDTNLILSVFRPKDDNYQMMKIISNQKHLQFVTGTITLVEIVSVLIRENHLFNNAITFIASKKNLEKLVLLPLELQISLFIDYLLNIFRIDVLEDDFPEMSLFGGKKIKISTQYKLIINKPLKTQLRTLDLLHYNTTRYYSSIKDFKIDYLVTGDGNFQKMRENLKSESDTIIVSPETFIELECH